MVCLGTIAAIIALDMLFVFGFHLTVPYVSAVKYNYMALPFVCLLAASLADKGRVLIGTIEYKKKVHLVNPVLVGVGWVLLLASLIESISFLNDWTGFVAFGVDSVTYYGFYVYSEATNPDLLNLMQGSAMVLVVGILVLTQLLVFLRLLRRNR